MAYLVKDLPFKRSVPDPFYIKTDYLPKDGDSAYAIWLGLGNSGTVQEFIDSLKGEAGDTAEFQATETHFQWRIIGDPDWINIVAFADLRGESNYEYAVRIEGYTGTEEEYYSDVSANRVAAETAQGLAEDAAEQTALDVTQTGSDRTQTGLDVIATAADRIATGQDRTQTGLDRTQTGLDRTQTGQDKIATAADRVQTGLDVVSAAASALAASASANSLEYKHKFLDDGTLQATGDDQTIITVTESLAGKYLVSAHASVTTASTSGTPTYQLRNKTQANADMLSTRITIDLNAYNSYTATVPPVVDATKRLLTLGDRIAIDCDVAGNLTKGTEIILKVANS